MPTPYGTIICLDPETGKELWSYKLEHSRPAGRAVAYWPGDKRTPASILFGTGDGRLYSLNAETGKPTAGFGIKGSVDIKTGVLNGFPHAQFDITSPVTIYKDLAFTGGQVQEAPGPGASGDTRAWDVHTGKLVWRFHSVPHPGEGGNNTWPGTSWKNRSGTNVWGFMSLDLERGLLFLPYGSPSSDFYGADRKGMDLFGNSLVALHADTGKLAWYFQTVHHDIWDYDTAANPMVLFDLQIKGQMRHALASMGKTGWIYILDRRTGVPILGIPERKVPQEASQHTWPTQPIPNGDPFAAQCANKAQWSKWKAPDGKPAKIGCIFTPYNGRQYTVFAPTALGGTDWPPSSYSSKTGYMYVCSKDSSGAWKALPPVKAGGLKPLGNFFQIEGLFQPKGSPGLKPIGKVVAMNMRTNKRVWSVAFAPGDMCYSGVMSTAGGLVFVGRNNGQLQAYDDQTGKLLWSSPKLLASVAAPPMTYTVNDKQYVAVYAGGNGIAAGSATAKVKYGSDLYTFALPS
jgi:quinoprotein glucose dehydrogenase